MNWLKENVYIAAWLALPVTLFIGLYQARKTEFKTVKWFRLLTYFTFLTALAVAFTPTFEAETHQFARYLVSVLLAVIIVSRHE
jgi:hypothetical protein